MERSSKKRTFEEIAVTLEDDEPEDDDLYVAATAQKRASQAKRASAAAAGEADEQDIDMEDILALVDNAPEVPELDLGSLGVLGSKLEAAYQKNEHLRVKYSDNPNKFMESEMELNDAIKALKQLSTSAQLYEKFCKMAAMKVLLNLLSHENTDIALSVIDILQELLDTTITADDEEARESIAIFVEMFMETSIELLIQNLDRLDPDDDQEGIYNVLNILENLAEFNPKKYCSQICKTTKILPFLIARLKRSAFDENTQYCAEILSIFVQATDDEVKSMLGTTGAMLTIAEALSNFCTRRNLRTEEEYEYCNNMCDTLANCFTVKDNKLKFFNFDVGPKALLQLIRTKRQCKNAALRALNLVITDCPSNCSKFIALGGLKAIFASFMKRETKKNADSEDSNEENTVSIIVQLFVSLSDIEYARLLRKFHENEYEKIDRLIELHDKYLQRSEDIKKLREKSQEDDDEDAELRARELEQGVFALQLVDLTIGFICTAGDEGMKKRIEQVLHQLDSSISDVKTSLQDLQREIGNDKNKDAALNKDLVKAILDML